MIRGQLLFASLILLFTACGGGKTPYLWQAETAVYMAKYQEMILKGDAFQARYYLNDAVREAQNDPSLQTLAVLYLGKCAMEKSMALKPVCSEYDTVAGMVNDPKLDAYKAMLSAFEVKESDLLGKYSSLYRSLEAKEVSLEDIKGLDTIYAKAIGAMLIYDRGLISDTMVSYMIDQASLENMKGLMFVWLDIAQSRAEGEALKLIKRKIELLRHKK